MCYLFPLYYFHTDFHTVIGYDRKQQNKKNKQQNKQTNTHTPHKNKIKQNKINIQKATQNKNKTVQPSKQTNKQTKTMRMIISPITWTLILIVNLLYFIQEAQDAPKVKVSSPFVLSVCLFFVCLFCFVCFLSSDYIADSLNISASALDSSETLPGI